MGENQFIVEPNISNERFTDILNETNCPCTVRILKFLIGSRRSELTLINQFLYQSIITNGVNNNLSNALKTISNESTQHLELLGNAVIKFGGILKFSNGQGTPWSVRYLNYETNQNTFLNNNIRLLENVIANYERAIFCVTNDSLKKLLREIVEDKRRYIEVFRGYLN